MTVTFRAKSGQSYTPDKCPTKLLQGYARAPEGADVTDEQREAAIDELSRRDDDPATAAAPAAPVEAKPQTTGLAKALPTDLRSFVTDDTDTLNSQMIELSRRTHLISPSSAFSKLPDGYEAQINIVTIDTAEDCVSIEGKLMISGAALKRVATAAGISWDPDRTRRMDDRRIVNLWECQAVGTYVDVDGRLRVLSGMYEFDCRDGSARAEGARSPRDLQQLRKSGLQRAETGAKSRAIAELIKRTEGGPNAWKKPIACVRLIARTPIDTTISRLYPLQAPSQAPSQAAIDIDTDPLGSDGSEFE